MIVLYSNRHREYGEKVVKALSEYMEGVVGFEGCERDFSNGEYVFEIHDGKKCNRKTCRPELCPNPHEFRKLLDKDPRVLAVVRGSYGDGWDSDRIVATTRQISDQVKSGFREYELTHAEKLFLFWPNTPKAKQDKGGYTRKITDEERELLKKTHDWNCFGDFVSGPNIIRQLRDDLESSGVDFSFEFYPHDYRRPGGIYKKAFPGQWNIVYDDWGRMPEKEQSKLEVIEDRRGQVWAIDPTHEAVTYLKTNDFIPDIVVGPDLTSSKQSIQFSRELGVWSEAIQKIRRGDESVISPNLKKELFHGKKVVLVDDIWVRGTTALHAIDDIRKAGASEIKCLIYNLEMVGNSAEKAQEMGIPVIGFDTIKGPFATLNSTEIFARDFYFASKKHPDKFNA